MLWWKSYNFCSSAFELQLVIGLGKFTGWDQEYKTTALLGGSWISVSTSPRGVFCLTSSTGTSLIALSQENTGVCSWSGGIDLDAETGFKAHNELLTAPALNISLKWWNLLIPGQAAGSSLTNELFLLF